MGLDNRPLGEMTDAPVVGGAAGSMIGLLKGLQLMRENTEFTLVSAGARVANVSSPVQINTCFVGVMLWIKVISFAVPGNTLNAELQFISPNGDAVGVLQLGARNTPGVYIMSTHAGTQDMVGGVPAEQGFHLPRRWRLQTYHGGAGAIEYEITGCYLV